MPHLHLRVHHSFIHLDSALLPDLQQKVALVDVSDYWVFYLQDYANVLHARVVECRGLHFI